MRIDVLAFALMTALLAGGAVAQDQPAPQSAVDVTKAVRCQTLFIQFNDRLATSKASDEAKKTAREALAAGNKACNEKNFDAGMDQIRTALTTIDVKPLY